MSRLTQKGATAPIEVFTGSTDLSLESLVGSLYNTSDGREFVLVQNGGTATVPGKLYQAPVAVGANHQNLTVTAFSAATVNALATVTVTLGATLATTNQYQQGYLSVRGGTGAGQYLKISKHPSAALSASLVVTLEDNPVTALDATSVVDLVLSPFGTPNGTNASTNGIVLASHTALVQPVGVSPYVIAATTTSAGTNGNGTPAYGLLQTKGVCNVLMHGTPAIGLDVGASASVDGAVDAYAVATGARIGTAIITGVDTKYMPVNLQL